MKGITEHNIFILLLQLSIIIFLTFISGNILKKYKQPTITGDILVGIILGPTILGKYYPNFFNFLFPEEIVQISLLDTIGWLGLFLVLLSTGIEVNLTSIWKQKKEALNIALLDIVIPIGIAMVFLSLLPDKIYGNLERKFLINIFTSVIMTISALPISIRILKDLKVLKSDLGFLIVSALTINDIIGWIIFTILLSFFEIGKIEYGEFFKLTFYTILFTVGSLTLGRKLMDKYLHWINIKNQRQSSEAIEEIISLIFLCGIIFGLTTLAIGIHSLFGFFIAGIMVGDSKELSEETRNIIHKFVYSVFISIFFVNIGLKIDFFKEFNLFLSLFITFIGIFGRYLGAWFGSYILKKSSQERDIISIAHTPGGEMHIVVSILALRIGLLNEEFFVAIIFGALVSSIIAGPWMAYKKRTGIKN
ncbi:MAG: cation:proton antiporter [Cetobacterium sp.]